MVQGVYFYVGIMVTYLNCSFLDRNKHRNPPELNTKRLSKNKYRFFHFWETIIA